ncbi:MAG: ABC transporter permease subunit [Proteobacteria bacterium]|nr:ABC transporter permease subunit [Pseudomonadota bacterium]
MLAGFVLPILGGLAVTAEAAFDHLPALGRSGSSLAPWRQLAGLPGVALSLALSVASGAGATLLALVLAFALVAFCDRLGATGRLARSSVPFLAVPHAALALGLAFVLAPSGWIARLISPWATGWTLPPDLPLVHDPAGLALTLGLAVKETPFLVLAILAALAQIGAGRQAAAGRALGYGHAQVWLWILAPQVYRLIRLPVYAVLVFSLTVVDMAVILGPGNPPTLAQAVTRWLLAPDLSQLLPGAAGALAIGLVAAAAVAVWAVGERLLGRAGRRVLRRGRRGRAVRLCEALLAVVGLALAGLASLALLSLIVWSLAWHWRFPDLLPSAWSLAGWRAAGADWGRPLLASLGLGLASTGAALALAIAWLEAEDRGGLGRARWAEALIYLPLLVPQVAVAFGLQVLALRAGISGGWSALVWGHVLYVFPYVMVALSDPWRAFDRRILDAAALLGAGPWRRLLAVRLPCLAAPLAAAAAVGFAVSIAQYVPTLFLGEGRIATLTTEAVALASGGDRRIAGVYGVLQTLLPFMAYGLAAAAVHRRRPDRGGQAGAAA